MKRCGEIFCCCCSSSKRKEDKKARLFKQGLNKLYTEIDLLEVVKQLRISRFMSSLFLTKNQCELVKFQRDYVLDLKRRRNERRRAYSRTASEARISEVELQAVPESITSGFNPDFSTIDAKLFENIVDEGSLIESRH